MHLTPADSPMAEFMSQHYVLVLSSSAIGLLTAVRKVGSGLIKFVMWGLDAFSRLHRAFYDCRVKCAENKRRFEATRAL